MKLKVPIKLDLSYYKENTDRHYQLQNFNIVAEIAADDEIVNIDPFSSNSFYTRLINNIFRPKIRYIGNYIISEGSSGVYCKKINRINRPVYLIGYWQHEKYFKEIKNTLLEELNLKKEPDSKNKLIKAKILKYNSVSLHVRRGDYLLNENFAICDRGYYSKAINIVESRISNPVFFVFSDDIEWAQLNISANSDIEFIDFNKDREYLDLDLMKACKNNIIANSTFSWWGAWLNPNPDKLVIAPQKWANNPILQKRYNQNGFIPESWLQL